MKRGGGRGPGSDLAEKPGFLTFFDHFGPLARPMEGCVDFYHTNFSRRTHPCHPELLPLSRMSKSYRLYPFNLDLGANFGLTFDKLLANFGPTFGRLLADFGSSLGRLWADFGSTFGGLGGDFGPNLSDFGPPLGQL